MGSESPHPNPLPEALRFPHPNPLPEGEGVKSTYSETGTIQSPLPLGEGKGEGCSSNPLPLREDSGEGALKSPLSLGEGKGEGLREAVSAHMIDLAKNLRKNQTDAEKLMWQLLRNRQVANAKFRRQQPIEGYIADFYCHEHKLVIELDGSQHFTEDGIKQDALRTQRLNQLGITVLRFDNRQVLLETEAVLGVIYEQLKRPHPKPLTLALSQRRCASLTPALSQRERELKSPHPSPLPEGEGAKSAHSEIGTNQSPLPLGEGKGEGALIHQNLEGLGYGE